MRSITSCICVVNIANGMIRVAGIGASFRVLLMILLDTFDDGLMCFFATSNPTTRVATVAQRT